MISKTLIDLLNSGDAIAFAGSGISADAGAPSWPGLFANVARELDAEGCDTAKARDETIPQSLPARFDALAKLTSRADIHQRVARLTGSTLRPGDHHRRLADWPFRFFITTNYDHLLERASNGNLVPIGNRGNELSKVSAGLKGAVWHAHGASELDPDRSQIVITQSDYDDFYPASNVVDKLKAMTTAHRCVFVGFGFNDDDFISMLKAVGRLSSSGRPSFAFLGYDKGADIESHKRTLLRNYNVEVVPYTVVNGDHNGLHRLLESYNPFIVRRSLSFGNNPPRSPDYEPVAASLRVQSSLDLGELSARNPDLRKSLIGARVLAYIRENPTIDTDKILDTCAGAEIDKEQLLAVITELHASGVLSNSTNPQLSKSYIEKCEAAQATVDFARDRFVASLRSRTADTAARLDSRMEEKAVEIVGRFMGELCRERGLGVAQNLATKDPAQANRRSVSLVQSLPSYLDDCGTHDEAMAVVQLAVGLLTSPTAPEREFLGLLCQGYFGQHLVGASDRLAQVDVSFISGSCYILDASVLICLLAEGGEANDFTRRLVADLVSQHAFLCATDLLLDEVFEHVRWATRLVGNYGENSDEVLDALRGRRSYRQNQFLRGYFFGAEQETSFASYIARIFSIRSIEDVTQGVVKAELERRGIAVINFGGWEGFSDELYSARDEVQTEINKRRMALGTYKHDRQTLAEAEVALVVDRIRAKTLRPPNADVKDAFFVSSTRVVDQLPELDRRISLLPDGLAQWLWSSKSISEHHAGLVFDELLWDLAQSGVQFVDNSTLLRRFSGIVEAAESELRSALSDRKELLLEKYGPDPDRAFTDTDPLDFPRLANEVQSEILSQMERKVAAAQESAKRANAAAKVSEKERAELAALRAQQAERQRKAKQKTRAAASKKGKKRKKK